ncbi:hypothetical protein [Synechococcus elongatus]|uniref:Uncharacterized protein n=2 Tax=Synechococcus elongatus TaxID=32046 RepID=Q31LX6_SYNE7|nr:hypothetical protein [Synechococcus elongatus]ABB57943.1 conserved hypothetical protein [Synechococcus elongatus PCC 7942 = FACHB-805]AJD57577.1 hypothetical protein M744_06860 [Synechococcus elongatus UTEX 2973]MBD2586661.1 hypothetical protein [Synechococcus elongatus FACHB-242]MBD2687735.1 hypothetical protein [Synechococcus elongatus FACHB-1061]MBD2706555.1 hypothetical protein [Synechococcus elongatus PCC 7942 = FACHB-805]
MAAVPRVRSTSHRDRPPVAVAKTSTAAAAPCLWLEPTLKLTLLLAVATLLSTSGLRLLQSASTRLERLQELDAELQLTERRVQILKNDFARVFSTAEARTVMQEQGNWIQPGQKRIVWQESSPETSR